MWEGPYFVNMCLKSPNQHMKGPYTYFGTSKAALSMQIWTIKKIIINIKTQKDKKVYLTACHPWQNNDERHKTIAESVPLTHASPPIRIAQ